MSGTAVARSGHYERPGVVGASRQWQRQHRSLPASSAAARQQQHARRTQEQQQQQQQHWRGRASTLRPCQAVAVDVEPSPALGSIDIESLQYKEGQFTVEGCLITLAPPELVYQVLTDYDALPRVFHNVDSSALRRCSVTGQKQMVQTCRWAFLVFSGTFVNELNVVEDPRQRKLTFSLVQSAFMREFVGSWDLQALPCGATQVRHRLSVTPVVSPPQRIGDLSKKIFRKQVVSILEDLRAELQSRLNGVQASLQAQSVKEEEVATPNTVREPKAKHDGSPAQPSKLKRQFTQEQRDKMAAASRQYWERWREERGVSRREPRDTSIDRRRQPKSPEVRAKMSAAAKKRTWDVAVRVRMSRSHKGRMCSPKVRRNMAAGQQARRARERAARGGAAQNVRSGSPQPRLSEELAREAAVIELSRLRQVVFKWMSAYEREHGRKPSLPETADINPDIYRAFVRYVGLREMLRGNSSGALAAGAGGVAGAGPSQPHGRTGPSSGRP
ncbi:hypothetical protein ACK3TF_000398 [Chlorella vulgaris]